MLDYFSKLRRGVKITSEVLLYLVPFVGDYLMFRRSDDQTLRTNLVRNSISTGIVRGGIATGTYFLATNIQDNPVLGVVASATTLLYMYTTFKIGSGTSPRNDVR